MYFKEISKNKHLININLHSKNEYFTLLKDCNGMRDLPCSKIANLILKYTDLLKITFDSYDHLTFYFHRIIKILISMPK